MESRTKLHQRFTPFKAGLLICLAILAGLALYWALQPGFVSAQPLALATPGGRVASSEELEKALLEWQASSHAESYDNGLGANTTCASCKSPRNWDPTSAAIEAAHDCGSCKRIPGEPRPDLEGGVRVPYEEWKHISCDICHQPVGDSYYVEVVFWNQARLAYEPVESVNELCAKCHEGTHGFHVVEEQEASPAHQGWECTRCHGAHGSPAACEDCHDPATGVGAGAHAMHPEVNCTACHDAGGLTIWQEPEENNRHYETYITRRFAHTLTSWPSHNIQTQVRCERCHHPASQDGRILAERVSCEACHPDGAVLFWCTFFDRDQSPYREDQSYSYPGEQP